MWNKNKSLTLSRVAVALFMALLAAAAVAAPWLTRWFLASRPWLPGGASAVPQRLNALFLVTVYLSVPLAALTLWDLRGLLARIGAQQIFVPANERAPRRISWYCLAEAAVCLASSFYYVAFLLVAVAAAFMALIVRVVKNVFAEAIALKDENDYTI